MLSKMFLQHINLNLFIFTVQISLMQQTHLRPCRTLSWSFTEPLLLKVYTGFSSSSRCLPHLLCHLVFCRLLTISSPCCPSHLPPPPSSLLSSCIPSLSSSLVRFKPLPISAGLSFPLLLLLLPQTVLVSISFSLSPIPHPHPPPSHRRSSSSSPFDSLSSSICFFFTFISLQRHLYNLLLVSVYEFVSC